VVPEKPKRSRRLVPDENKGDWVLAKRAPSEPGILAELQPPVDLMIRQHQSPGDIVMLTATIRDLHLAWPGQFRTDVLLTRENRELFLNNPFITPLERNAPTTNLLHAHYFCGDTANVLPYHFIHGFRLDFEQRLGLAIPATAFKGDIHLTDAERVHPFPELAGKDIWLIDAGGKADFTAKHWEFARFQAVVDALPEVHFAQIGAKEHLHQALHGRNVTQMVGKTTIRQLVRLMYQAQGVITPVSFPMHLSAAVPLNPRYHVHPVANCRVPQRPCVVIAGGREPAHWEAYPTHAYLHTCGQLDCCLHGGCWRSRAHRRNDGWKQDSSLCFKPVTTASGQIIPSCLDMITTDTVVEAVRRFRAALPEHSRKV